MPKAKCIFEGSVKYVNADIKKALDGVPVPPHLLFLRHALCDDLVDCGLGEPGRYSGSRAIAFAVVRHGIGVRFEVSNHVKQRFAQLLQGWKVVETPGCGPVREMREAYDSPLRIAVPETPLCPLNLGQSVFAQRSVG